MCNAIITKYCEKSDTFSYTDMVALKQAIDSNKS